ncbi:hypothetical protein AB0M54_44225 [Actinoplanes sp. NPDC051470]|uniref:hypothetical protein n=1 Tax=Actinoplanes sp. NPDC051470 TaxID=3157224 RepID=UPI003443DB28
MTVEVADAAVLQEAALSRVAEGTFVANGDRGPDEVLAAEREDVRGDTAAALSWVTDADAVVETGVGVEVVGSHLSIAEGDGGAGGDSSGHPDFGRLFPVCRCAVDDCEACSGFQVSPRTAAVLWSVTQLHADFAYDDVTQYGDARVFEDGGWVAFADYPRITWGQDAIWRRQAARAFDDLAADLAVGRWPLPTCPGEEMAVHLMFRSADGAARDGWGTPAHVLAALPEHGVDYDWESLFDVLLQDDDILRLFDGQLDGIEDPESEANRSAGMGDYRPEAWFRPFLNATPRDSRRGFRR